jgi:protein-disulfide isomerase
MKKAGVLTSLVLIAAAAAYAGDPSQLKPPKGFNVALVEFVDLQCPDCANAAPVLEDARRTYKMPLVRYDFPLQKHNWARQAAVLARFFDTKSKTIGDDFRAYCFQHQPGHEAPVIATPADLQEQARKFAADRHITLPLIVDPDGKLEAKVNQDVALGNSVGIEHTPTIYVVSNKAAGKPFVEVVDRDNLFQQIDEMIAATGGVSSGGSHGSRRDRKTAASAQ